MTRNMEVLSHPLFSPSLVLSFRVTATLYKRKAVNCKKVLENIEWFFSMKAEVAEPE